MKGMSYWQTGEKKEFFGMGVVKADKAIKGEGVKGFGLVSHLAILQTIKREQISLLL